MRLTIICILAAMLPVGASVAAAPVRDGGSATRVIGKHCPPRTPQLATSGQVRVFRHPGEFPPADLHHAVDRRLDNCPIPAIVRRNVGR